MPRVFHFAAPRADELTKITCCACFHTFVDLNGLHRHQENFSCCKNALPFTTRRPWAVPNKFLKLAVQENLRPLEYLKRENIMWPVGPNDFLNYDELEPMENGHDNEELKSEGSKVQSHFDDIPIHTRKEYNYEEMVERAIAADEAFLPHLNNPDMVLTSNVFRYFWNMFFG
ncbi:uncharacterized protein LOC117640795 [Thrips palmi]|uniref:Uncharacterized protein LOC117640790 n=1 Tax=Thrips palmi TaxID=161013 RepID=A0A6P8Y1Y4_THRPL|nr:uncharacterized protein LOC117640790 [Thrips palmi]XP_034233557.1 uncharacterized protein LOC117640795 [Thrips palmi]